MRVTVTGGAGFIGSNLARAAVADPQIDQVTVLDDLSTGLLTNLDGTDVTFIEGSLLDPRALDEAVAGRDAVVHLGALGSVPRSLDDPVRSHQVNATGTLLLLEACRRHRVGHVIVASSSSVYGSNPALPKSELAWTRPMSPYAASKLAAEAYTLAHQTSYGLPVLVFRFFNVYGPRQRPDHAYAAVIPRFVHAALSGDPVVVHGDGTQSRDFTYVGTVCDVLLEAIRRRVHHAQPVNLAFGAPASLLQILEELEDQLGHRVPRRFEPGRVGDVAHSLADDRLLRELFPAIDPVGRRAGLQATIRWMADSPRTLAQLR
ncbi:NAD-dependent epimerase/dehydratase family protein [Nakamurella sp.]|uniref:NAD-dependent epimerase/dehydratase family protein n=1 Tax=Nakamurella sp. TaxID=1869182 RepID=UPI003B3B0835